MSEVPLYDDQERAAHLSLPAFLQRERKTTGYEPARPALPARDLPSLALSRSFALSPRLRNPRPALLKPADDRCEWCDPLSTPYSS